MNTQVPQTVPRSWKGFECSVVAVINLHYEMSNKGRAIKNVLKDTIRPLVGGELQLLNVILTHL